VQTVKSNSIVNATCSLAEGHQIRNNQECLLCISWDTLACDGFIYASVCSGSWFDSI